MEFILRPWLMEDAENLAWFANNKNVSRYMMNRFPFPYTLQPAYEFIEHANSTYPTSLLAISVDGIAVGGIGLHRQNDISIMNAELGYWLGEPYWGKGIMTEAVRRMVEYGFIHFDFNRIFARPFGSNFASQKVLEKAGFVLEARFYGTFFKDGIFEDELVYAVRRLVV